MQKTFCIMLDHFGALAFEKSLVLRCDARGAPTFRFGERALIAARGFKPQSKIDPKESPKGAGDSALARTPDGGFDLAKWIEAQEGRGEHAEGPVCVIQTGRKDVFPTGLKKHPTRLPLKFKTQIQEGSRLV